MLYVHTSSARRFSGKIITAPSPRINGTRHTTSSFMRLKLSGQLSDRGLAPHVYESRSEALTWLGQ